MSHSAFCCLNKHREKGLLEGITEVFLGVLLGLCFPLLLLLVLLCLAILFASHEFFNKSENTRETHVHAFHNVRKLDVILTLLSHLFNVISGTRVIREVNNSCESIKTVSYSNINRFSKYSIAFLTISDNLGVTSRDIKNCGIFRLCHNSTHFDVTNTMINSNYRLVVQLR